MTGMAKSSSFYANRNVDEREWRSSPALPTKRADLNPMEFFLAIVSKTVFAAKLQEPSLMMVEIHFKVKLETRLGFCSKE